jgi:hypothetical protein
MQRDERTKQEPMWPFSFSSEEKAHAGHTRFHTQERETEEHDDKKKDDKKTFPSHDMDSAIAASKAQCHLLRVHFDSMTLLSLYSRASLT